MRWWMVAACVAWAGDASAQRFFHDKERDATAQQAVTAAKQVTSGALFDTMLRNVDAEARIQVDIEMANVLEQMRAKLNAFQTFHAAPGAPAPGACSRSVQCALENLQSKHKAALAATTLEEIDQRLVEIAKQREALKKELKDLEEASGSSDPAVIRAFDALDDPGRDLLDQAQSIAKLGGTPTAGLLEALDSLSQGLDQVRALYGAVRGIWAGRNAVSVPAVSLRPPQQQIDLQLLAVEQDHLKLLARIKAREQVEVRAALLVVETALNRLKAQGVAEAQGSIETALKDAAGATNRDDLEALLSALHEASAAVAQMDAAERLADLRRAHELRRHSIRRSLVNARTYDQTIQAAVERLALYWKSGLKPGELAELVFHIVNAIAVPAIALQE